MPKAKPRVLLVDDDPQIGKIFGIKLRTSGFDTVVTNRGSEAIELARKEHFDAMLLDILMPELSGFDVLSQVRTFSQIPVIVFTARPDIFEKAKRIGATDFIAKPLNPDDLVKKIKTVLAKKTS